MEKGCGYPLLARRGDQLSAKKRTGIASWRYRIVHNFLVEEWFCLFLALPTVDYLWVGRVEVIVRGHILWLKSVSGKDIIIASLRKRHQLLRCRDPIGHYSRLLIVSTRIIFILILFCGCQSIVVLI